MPRKPTQPYGHIAFGKDGSVRKVVGELPGTTFGQEREVGQNFAAKLGRTFDQHISLEMCEENNHDFYLNFDHQKVLVQATEIVSRDYLRPLEVDDYVNGRHPYTEFVQEDDKIFGVDVAAKETILLKRIRDKIGKYYAKPPEPLWLLVWTVCGDFFPFWVQGGEPCVSLGVKLAREYLSTQGTGPFDNIWFFGVQTSPSRVWPVPGALGKA